MGRSTPAKARCAHFGIARRTIALFAPLYISNRCINACRYCDFSSRHHTLPRITLSTREAPAFRDRMAELCADTLSAGSHVTPGGYAHPTDQTAQFSLADTRSAAEVIAALRARHLDPIFKQWA